MSAGRSRPGNGGPDLAAPRRTPAPHEEAPLRRRILSLAAAFAAGLLIAGPGWSLVAQVGDGDPQGVERIAADLAAQEADRNRAEAASLVERAESLRDGATPVVEGLSGAYASGGGPAAPPSSEDLTGWAATLQDEIDRFGEAPSAALEITQAHNALRTSVGNLLSSVMAYQAAIAAEGSGRARLEDLAATLRDRAIDSWSIGAVALDEASIEYGLGHRHLDLSGDSWDGDADHGDTEADREPGGSGGR